MNYPMAGTLIKWITTYCSCSLRLKRFLQLFKKIKISFITKLTEYIIVLYMNVSNMCVCLWRYFYHIPGKFLPLAHSGCGFRGYLPALPPSLPRFSNGLRCNLSCSAVWHSLRCLIRFVVLPQHLTVFWRKPRCLIHAYTGGMTPNDIVSLCLVLPVFHTSIHCILWDGYFDILKIDLEKDTSRWK